MAGSLAMCGLVGWLTRTTGEGPHEAGHPASAAAMVAALGALAHRGPDGQGVCRLGGGVSGLLGHARLAILDLSPAGAQPMAREAASGRLHPGAVGPEEGDQVLVFNGEIYNFRALRARLVAELSADPARREEASQVAACESDTAVLLALFARWGVARTLPELVGMFAFAFWDGGSQTLTLGRDRLGIKPLYLRATATDLAFASETRALVAAHRAGPLEAGPAEVARWARHAACEDPQTLLPEVSQLSPGHTLVWHADGRPTVLTRYWAPHPAPRGLEGAGAGRPDGLAPAPRDRSEAAAQLAPILDAAVRDRLLADVPLAVFLSGGVDSAAIAAVAARHVPDTLAGVTLAFGASGTGATAYNEDARAAALARHLGLRHHVVHVSEDAALAAVPAAFAAQDLPSHDGVNTWLVARAAQGLGFKVCLSGTGGDELFGGYPHAHHLRPLLAAARAAALLPRGLRHPLAAALGARLAGLGRVGARISRLAELLAVDPTPEALARLVREVFGPRDLAGLLGEEAADLPPAAVGPLPGLDAAGRLTVAELRGYLGNTQLRDIDAMSMAHGLEVRVPLLDHRLVAAVLALPGHLKAPIGRGLATLNKPLLVAAAGLPAELLRVPKTGFVLPWEVWLPGALRPFAEDALFGAAPALPLRPEAVRALWQVFLARPERRLTTRVLGLIALRLWARRTAGMTDRTPSGDPP